jgi:predicted oxidoreductase
MRYLDWGEDGRKVSVIGIGCMRMDDLPAAQVDAVIDAALECGIDFFDHADIYGDGECEKKFGKALKRKPTLRDRIFIQSKCSIRDGLYDFSAPYIISSVEGILSRLGTDHIDSLLLHRPDALMEPEEVQMAFSRLYGEGKVLSFGVSNFNRFQLELLQSGLSFPIMADQMQFSLAHTPMIDEGINVNTMFDGAVMRTAGTLEYCRMHRIAVQTWSPLQKGFFGGVFLGDPEYAELNGVLERLASQYGVSADTIAYAWLLRYPARMQVITGTMNPDRIASAARAADIGLTREEWYELYRAAGNELP